MPPVGGSRIYALSHYATAHYATAHYAAAHYAAAHYAAAHYAAAHYAAAHNPCGPPPPHGRGLPPRQRVIGGRPGTAAGRGGSGGRLEPRSGLPRRRRASVMRDGRGARRSARRRPAAPLDRQDGRKDAARGIRGRARAQAGAHGERGERRQRRPRRAGRAARRRRGRHRARGHVVRAGRHRHVAVRGARGRAGRGAARRRAGRPVQDVLWHARGAPRAGRAGPKDMPCTARVLVRVRGREGGGHGALPGRARPGGVAARRGGGRAGQARSGLRQGLGVRRAGWHVRGAPVRHTEARCGRAAPRPRHNRAPARDAGAARAPLL